MCVCVQESIPIFPGVILQMPAEFTIEKKKIFPQHVKVTGIHYNVALFQETVSEYYFFFF